MFSDIFNWFPTLRSIPPRDRDAFLNNLSYEEKQQWFRLATAQLDAWCEQHQKICQWRVAIELCGTPCVDFSSSGRRLGVDGPSMSVFFAWVRAVLTMLPMMVVHENVQGFPEQLIRDCFAHLYIVFSMLVSTDDHAVCHISRRRRYTIMYLRSAVLTHRGEDLIVQWVSRPLKFLQVRSRVSSGITLVSQEAVVPHLVAKGLPTLDAEVFSPHPRCRSCVPRSSCIPICVFTFGVRCLLFECPTVLSPHGPNWLVKFPIIAINMGSLSMRSWTRAPNKSRLGDLCFQTLSYHDFTIMSCCGTGPLARLLLMTSTVCSTSVTTLGADQRGVRWP